MHPRTLFAELRRRNVYKVAVAYALVGWLLIQIASATFPFLQIPNWGTRLVIGLVILAFPIALILAWAFEMTPSGIQRTHALAPGTPPASSPARRRAAMILAIVLATAVLATFQILRSKSAGGVTDKSIAVLPFENRSEDKSNAYFADGVQDEIVTLLSKIADLKVISRTSTLQYQSEPRNLTEVAKQLGVANVLEGSVQK